MRLPVFTLAFPLLALIAGDSSAADDPRMEARNRAREAAVQSAGIRRALSKEMPESVKSLPVFGGIEWTVKELPFVEKGPHAGISGAGMAVVDGQIYLAGGFIPAGDETEDVSRRTSRWAYRYDPKSDQWSRLPDLPARREYTRAIGADKALYVLGGGEQLKPFAASADVFQFDVSKTPQQWRLAPMNVARTHLAVGKIGSLLIAIGGNKYDFAEKGYSPATIQGVTEVFDLAEPGEGWKQRAPIPGSPRGWCASAVVGEKLYLLGGVTWTDAGRKRLQEALSYDPVADRWATLAAPPFAISGWEGDVYRDRYIITLGGASKHWSDIPFVYDTKTDQWMRIDSPLPPGGLFNDPGVCVIGDTIYVAGGEGPGGSHFNHFLIGKIKPALIGQANSASTNSLVEIIETKIISQQPQFYHGWPTVALCKDGRLVLVYSGGRDYHVCPFGRLEMMTSHDGGANWTWPRVLADSATDDRDTGIMATARGTLLATFYTSSAYQQHMNNPERLLNKTFGDETPAMLRRWKLLDQATTDEEKKSDFGYWMLRSTDGGLTWSSRYKVPAYNPHGPTQLADGRLFYAAANGKKSGAYISEDDGLTWNLIAELPLRAGELHNVQAADGTLIAQVRHNVVTPEGRVQYTAQTTSTDDGKTWTPQERVADGYPSHLVRLNGGTLLMTYGWRQEPFGIRGKISSDHGRSWSDEFVLCGDAATWDVGYPSTVQLPDGTLLTVWYEAPKDSHKAVLRQAHWRLSR